jgi:hypothetical protein
LANNKTRYGGKEIQRLGERYRGVEAEGQKSGFCIDIYRKGVGGGKAFAQETKT